MSGGNSNFARDVLTELRGKPGVEVDMLDVHIYPDQRSAIPWRICVRTLWPAFRAPSRTLCPSCCHPHAGRCALVETVEGHLRRMLIDALCPMLCPNNVFRPGRTSRSSRCWRRQAGPAGPRSSSGSGRGASGSTTPSTGPARRSLPAGSRTSTRSGPPTRSTTSSSATCLPRRRSGTGPGRRARTSTPPPSSIGGIGCRPQPGPGPPPGRRGCSQPPAPTLLHSRRA